MRRIFACTPVVFAIVAVALVFTAPTASAGTPVTGTSSAAAPALGVTVTVPGLVGVDVESPALAWDFNVYQPAPNSVSCANSTNQWPISITCAGETAGTLVTFDPTSDTTPSPAITPNPKNSTVVSAAGLAGLGADPNRKAIWLAFFCSKSGLENTMTLSTQMGSFAAGTTGLAVGNFYFRGDNTNNTGSTGGTSWTAFTGASQSLTHSGLGATFGWTRTDQYVSLQLPNNNALAQGTATATITYTIAK